MLSEIERTFTNKLTLQIFRFISFKREIFMDDRNIGMISKERIEGNTFGIRLMVGITSFNLNYLMVSPNVGSLTTNFSRAATKQEKLLQKRYAEFLKYPAVTKAITLPLVLPSTHGQSKSELTFSVSDGMKWKVRKNIERKQVNIPLDLMKYIPFTSTVVSLPLAYEAVRVMPGHKSRGSFKASKR